MSNRLEDVFQKTAVLYKLTEEKIPVDQRQERIADINRLLAERDPLLSQVVPPFTEEEKETGRELLLMNQAIQQKLLLLENEIKQNLIQVKKQKKTKQQYQHTYQGLAGSDGMFLDHKK